MQVEAAQNRRVWESFLLGQQWTPFLQSWEMGEVYRDIGQEPLRIEVRDGERTLAICQAVDVQARRGRHLAVLYGPVLADDCPASALRAIVEELKRLGRERSCAFIRMSPFWKLSGSEERIAELTALGFRPSPLHMLAEHVWCLDLRGKNEESVLMGMRKTTRNLVRRAEKDGVEVTASAEPLRDISLFLKMHSETRRRHGFTPYTDSFFVAQVKRFSPEHQCRLYVARYAGAAIASSIHMVYGGETSYHHGASSGEHPKVPGSYLLQWTAIREAIVRGDRTFNFWGVSPEGVEKHPFAGVRTFKTGFGGELLPLVHCMDLSLSPRYLLTWGIEQYRKRRRGF